MFDIFLQKHLIHLYMKYTDQDINFSRYYSFPLYTLNIRHLKVNIHLYNHYNSPNSRYNLYIMNLCMDSIHPLLPQIHFYKSCINQASIKYMFGNYLQYNQNISLLMEEILQYIHYKFQCLHHISYNLHYQNKAHKVHPIICRNQSKSCKCQ